MKFEPSVKGENCLRFVMMAFTAALLGATGCAGLHGTTGQSRTANLLTEASGPPAVDHVTIGPRIYNPETHSFDPPWPFGPESNQ